SKRVRVTLAQSLHQFRGDLQMRLSQKLMREQAAAHADLAVDAPHRKFYAFGIERALPGKDVLVDAIDERAVQIEQETRLDAHESLPGKALRIAFAASNVNRMRGPELASRMLVFEIDQPRGLRPPNNSEELLVATT